MRYRVASHRTSEYKKDRRKDRRFYHRECDPEHRLELRCIKDRLLPPQGSHPYSGRSRRSGYRRTAHNGVLRQRNSGTAPDHHHFGIQIPARDARSPFDVPTTALLLNTFCHTTASVHCGMMYGKMKIELKYFLNFRFVLVTKNAKVPP